MSKKTLCVMPCKCQKCGPNGLAIMELDPKGFYRFIKHISQKDYQEMLNNKKIELLSQKRGVLLTGHL